MVTTGWAKSFIARHPVFKRENAEILDAKRFEACTRANLSPFFDKFHTLWEQYKLDPALTFNFDETSINFTQKFRGKVIVSSQSEGINAAQPDRIASVTLSLCIPARGTALDSILLWPQKNIPNEFRYFPSHRIQVLPSTSSYQTRLSFEQCMLGYYIPAMMHRRRSLNIEETPILLVLDGHSSRLSTSFISTCRKNNIVVLVLPAHTSSVMQALDCSQNGVLKATFAKQSALRVNMSVLQDRADNGSIVEDGINNDTEPELPDLPEEVNNFAKKNQFTNSAAAHRRLLAEVLPIAVEAATSYSAMNAGWSKCGLVPFNPAKVLGMVQAGEKPVEDRGFLPNISRKEITARERRA